MQTQEEHVVLTPRAWRHANHDDHRDHDAVSTYAVLETSPRCMGRQLSVVELSTDPATKQLQPQPPPSIPSSSNPPHQILFLDGLRGLAAMLVVAQHSFYMIRHPVGQPAVDLFFVLSAFLLTMLFEKKARALLAQEATARRWALALLDYTMRRFLRVYPLFMVVALVVLALPDTQRKRYFVFFSPDKYELLPTLVFQFDARHHVFWTLPLEIMYYFIIPVFVVLLLVLRKWWWLPLLPLSYLVAYSGFTWRREDHQGLTPHLPTFLCGSMAAVVYTRATQWIHKTQFTFTWPAYALVRVMEMILLALVFSVVFEGLFFRWIARNPVPKGAGGGPFIAANVSLILVCEMLLPGAVSSVLEWSLLRFAGKISYSMYLLHSFVVFSPWIQKQIDDDWFFAIWLLVFALSTASYYAVEYPSQKLAAYCGAWIKKWDEAERLRPPLDRGATTQVPSVIEELQHPQQHTRQSTASHAA